MPRDAAPPDDTATVVAKVVAQAAERAARPTTPLGAPRAARPTANSVAPTPAAVAAPASAPASIARPAPAAEPAADAAAVAAINQTIVNLQGMLADERRSARERAQRTSRTLTIMAVALVVLAILGIAQMIVVLRFANESAAAQQRTEALLANQQTTLAALSDTVVKATTDAATGAIVEAPAQPDDSGAQPPVKHARAHQHRSKDKAKTSATH
ncbi:hypothetical protein D7S89_13100 [Trinickia fusca]|uniref:Uncharacterized protein n=1 Tax=Trinickia fusca TaxID=2419777 RepID=A0A494XCN4_9BURK|nr:hypothetical protein D7S89_13100 [Trinickia fusca]